MLPSLNAHKSGQSGKRWHPGVERQLEQDTTTETGFAPAITGVHLNSLSHLQAAIRKDTYPPQSIACPDELNG